MKKDFYINKLKNDRTKLKSVEFPYFKDVQNQSYKSVWDFIQKSAIKNAKIDCYGVRKFEENGERGDFVWESFEDTLQKINAFAKELDSIQTSLGPLHGEDETPQFEKIGIYSKNCPEWVIGAYAGMSIRSIPVPLYETLGVNAVEYLLNHAEIRIVILSADKIEKLIGAKEKGEIPSLKVLIQIDYNPNQNKIKDKLSETMKKRASDAGLTLVAFSELIEKGKQSKREFNPKRPELDDLGMIMYTSGTTGTPKGVMLSHKNFIAVIKSVICRTGLMPENSYISYLPLAHIFEFSILIYMFVSGLKVGFYSGEISTLFDDIAVLKPDVLIGVPRVFDKIHSKILKEVNKSFFLKKWLVHYALSRGVSQSVTSAGLQKTKMMDGMIWSKIRKKLGLENLKLILIGAAPCPLYLMEFLRVLFPAPILHGYGMTESTCAISMSQKNDPNLLHTGLPLNCEVRIQNHGDITENDGRGEILVRGDNVFVGYYKDPENTAKVLKDGWLHTGDVGCINPNGTISVLDRVKSIFKLSQGEYVSPEVVESAYTRSEAVNQIFIHGESNHRFVIGIVVPDVEWILSVSSSDKSKEAREALISKNIDELLRLIKEIGLEEEALFKKRMQENLKMCEANLRRFELVHDIHLEFDLDPLLNGFTVENKCLTPSFKMKRKNLFERYKAEIQAMYEK